MKKTDIITALAAACVLAVFLWFATMDIGNNTERLDSMEQKISQLEEKLSFIDNIPVDESGQRVKINK